MRAALWIALLLAAFVLAWQIQDRWSAERREERDAAYGRAGDAGGALPEGFSRVVIGEPSGAPAIQPPPGARTRNEEDGSPSSGAGGARNAPTSAGDANTIRRHVVVAGDSLSEICQAAYGTARKDLVDAVARANGLSNPGAIRIGQHIVLPPIGDLSAPPR